MAIKDWISRFSAGLGLDTLVAGGMETLVDDADASRVTQPHALRSTVIALERQVLGAPFFQWNETDLNQFDAKVDGAAVSASVVAVVAFAGKNWVSFDVTSGAGDVHTSSTILPITAAPPTADYLIMADFLNTTLGAGNERSAGVAARYVGAGPDYYSLRYTDTDGQLGKVATAAPTNLGPAFTGALAATNQGGKLILAVFGSGAEIILQTPSDVGLSQFSMADTASPHTAVGQAALFGGTEGAATQTINLFRNIQAFTLVT